MGYLLYYLTFSISLQVIIGHFLKIFVRVFLVSVVIRHEDIENNLRVLWNLYPPLLHRFLIYFRNPVSI